MKLISGIILTVFVIQSAYALPARNPNDDAEVVVVPLEKQGRRYPVHVDPDFGDFRGVVETEVGDNPPTFSLSPYNPFKWNFGFFDNFEDIFKRVRDQVFSRIPRPGSEDWPSIDIDSEIGDGDDDGKGNTTSTVKIIGDHKVVINDTVYTKKNHFGNSIFKVRTINVLPLDGTEEGVDKTDEKTDVNRNEPSATEEVVESDKGSPEILDKEEKNNEISGNIDSKEVTTPILK